MQTFVKASIGLAILGFLMAVIVVLFTGAIAGISAESFSRASTNLALIAIASHLAFRPGIPTE